MFIDRFTDPDPDPRVDPPTQAAERATRVGFVRFQRETLALKCSGLDAADLARRAAEPSNMSLLGLVEEYSRHNGHADLLRERIDGRVGQ